MRHTLYRSFSCAVLAIVVSTAGGMSPASATVYSIATLADDLAVNGNCTLREAVEAATTNIAVDACAAGSNSGPDTIALAAGTYPLPLGVIDLTSAVELRIHGPAVDPPTAVISGGTTHRIFSLLAGAGLVTLEDLELVDGNAVAASTPLGGAVFADASSLVVRRVLFRANKARRGGALVWFATGAAKSLVVEGCRFLSNEALHPDAFDAARGGALWLDPTGPASIVIRDSDFVGNRAHSALAGDFVAGGAIELVTEGSGAQVRFSRLRLIDNVAESSGSGGSAQAGAIRSILNSARLDMSDIDLEGNDLGTTISPGAAAMSLANSGAAVSTLDRLRIVGNGLEAGTEQVSILTSGASSEVVLRDTLVVGGEEGLQAAAGSDGILALDHLTVAGNSGSGLVLVVDGGSLFLSNSIAYGNGVDVEVIEGVPTIRPETLLGVDPLFVDAAAGNYTLAASSPAVDSGDAVWGYVGPLDLAHAARVVGPETDLGAFERGGLFSDGFETGTTASSRW